METSVEGRPVVRDYFNRSARAPRIRPVCLLVAAARIAVQCTRSLLRVRLLRGEVSFQTAQDPSQAPGSRRIVYSAATPGIIG
jgi:hypothetical protein